MCRKIMIGGAWPYANGSLHIGHLAGLLPGDVLARYHRAIGDEVYYVSGSDCHGTPVAIRAKQEGRTPREVSDAYHQEFAEVFRKLGFSYDEYGKTSQPEHITFVQAFHKRLYESEYVYEKEAPQAYCESCRSFLADRFVEGSCPKCGAPARGDQCDACGAVLEPENLVQPRCAVCQGPIVLKNSRHLYLSLTKCRDKLQKLVDSHPEWRKNALAFTNRYLQEGLRDRALTRDLDWGIDVPREGYEGKKIYIWAENVLGYLSMSAVVAARKGQNFDALWKQEVQSSGPKEGVQNSHVRESGIQSSCMRGCGIQTSETEFANKQNENRVCHYYVHAKDNIPFHTIILPALLIAEGSGYHLPDKIISNEYLTLEGRKISTSQNWAIWVKDIADVFQPDAIRYFLIANGPEKRDTDFSAAEFVKSINGELLGNYGNFVNRSLVFIQKYFDGEVPEGQIAPSLQGKLNILYGKTARLIEEGRFKEALENILEHLKQANKFFDSKAPWITRTQNPAACRNTLYNCVQIAANAAVLLAPFLPFSSEKIAGWLGIDLRWGFHLVQSGTKLPQIEILFERLDLEKAKELLHSGSKN